MCFFLLFFFFWLFRFFLRFILFYCFFFSSFELFFLICRKFYFLDEEVYQFVEIVTHASFTAFHRYILCRDYIQQSVNYFWLNLLTVSYPLANFREIHRDFCNLVIRYDSMSRSFRLLGSSVSLGLSLFCCLVACLFW